MVARVAVENKLSVSEAQRRLWLLVVTTNTQWGECSHTDRHPVLVTVIDINADHFVESRNTQAKVSFSIMVFFILDEIREQNFFHFIFTSFFDLFENLSRFVQRDYVDPNTGWQ